MNTNTEIILTIPAREDYVLVARMALSGMGAACGLDVDLIGDLRTATDECCDCLLHQPTRVRAIELRASRAQNRLCCRFEAVWDEEKTDCEPLDLDLTRGILETLMPDVSIQPSAKGIGCIAFSMPV